MSDIGSMEPSCKDPDTTQKGDDRSPALDTKQATTLHLHDAHLL